MKGKFISCINQGNIELTCLYVDLQSTVGIGPTFLNHDIWKRYKHPVAFVFSAARGKCQAPLKKKHLYLTKIHAYQIYLRYVWF